MKGKTRRKECKRRIHTAARWRRKRGREKEERKEVGDGEKGEDDDRVTVPVCVVWVYWY